MMKSSVTSAPWKGEYLLNEGAAMGNVVQASLLTDFPALVRVLDTAATRIGAEVLPRKKGWGPQGLLLNLSRELAPHLSRINTPCHWSANASELNRFMEQHGITKSFKSLGWGQIGLATHRSLDLSISSARSIRMEKPDSRGTYPALEIPRTSVTFYSQRHVQLLPGTFVVKIATLGGDLWLYMPQSLPTQEDDLGYTKAAKMLIRGSVKALPNVKYTSVQIPRIDAVIFARLGVLQGMRLAGTEDQTIDQVVQACTIKIHGSGEGVADNDNPLRFNRPFVMFTGDQTGIAAPIVVIDGVGKVV
jgi:hypothetical protein